MNFPGKTEVTRLFCLLLKESGSLYLVCMGLMYKYLKPPYKPLRFTGKMMENKGEIEATTGILSESSMENPFLISIINTCKKHSHHNIGRSFIKRLTSGASCDNE